MFQSTHPCGVRLKAVGMDYDKEPFQSTHPCGVRLLSLFAKSKPVKFQSTHPCGVRRVLFDRLSCASCFNPRTRVGCDMNKEEFDLIYRVVSIHAPVWGATHFAQASTITGGVQSTHPCGVRQTHVDWVVWVACFNPRTRVGCDTQSNPTDAPVVVSIHAPVWGATKRFTLIDT